MTGTRWTSPRKKRQPSGIRARHQHFHPGGAGYFPGCCRVRSVEVLNPYPCPSCGKVLEGIGTVFWLRTAGNVDDIVPVLWACPCGEPDALLACEIAL